MFEILSVDDQEIDRKIIGLHLRKLYPDVVIHERENGKQALEFIENYEKEIESGSKEALSLVMFLDINMPVLNGFEFLEAFESELLPNLKYIHPLVVNMLSSSKNTADIEKAKSFNVVSEYIVKYPVDREDLRAIIENSLKN